MPEHVHLLMTMPAVGDLSVAMEVVKERFTRMLRKREALNDRIWQKRFYDLNVCTDNKKSREAQIYASQSGETWFGSDSRRMGLE